VNKKNYTILVIATVALLLTLAIPLAGCASETSAPTGPSTATLSSATMCRNYNSKTGPGDQVDVFPRNASWITCAVKLSDAPPGTKAKAVWLYKGTPRYTEVTGTSGTKWLAFDIKPKDMGETVRFDAGDYAVKLFLNGEEKLTLSFKVE
jgi:hypothetical protein